MDSEPRHTLERCSKIFCALSPEDKVRWIAATKEGRHAIEQEHRTKHGLNWTMFEEILTLSAPGAERTLSENPDYIGPAPLVTD
jgi:hypothetical protein